MTPNDEESRAATDLSGLVAVVTGAAAGLGRAEAIGLARAGATVVVNDIAGALDQSDVIDEITAAGSKAVAVAGDISQRATADELVETADGLGGLSIVVNNAGITRDRMLFNMTDDDWDAVIAVHLRGHFLLTRNAATYWRAKAKEAGAARPATSGSAGIRVRPHRQHVIGGGPGRPGRAGQLRRSQGRHHGADVIGGTRAGAVRGDGQRHRPACPHRDDRRRVRGRARAGRGPDRRTIARACGDPGAVPFLAGGPRVNGQLFIVYGPTVTLVAAPTVETKFSAESDAWDPADLSATLHDYFADRDPERNFSATGLMGSRD